eukprot:scaffold22058_cov124-Isochrysis_galbana.AAC.4
MRCGLSPTCQMRPGTTAGMAFADWDSRVEASRLNCEVYAKERDSSAAVAGASSILSLKSRFWRWHRVRSWK